MELSIQASENRRMAKCVAIAMLSLYPLVCFAETFSNRASIAECEYALDMGTWVQKALMERMAVIDQAQELLPVNDTQQSRLAALKVYLSQVIPYYVDKAITSDNLANWFATPIGTNEYGGLIYPEDLPLMTVTGLLAYVGAPTNYFNYTPWRPLDDQSEGVTNSYTAYGFTTTDYGWKFMKPMITTLVWTRDAGCYEADEYSYWTNEIYCLTGSESCGVPDIDCYETPLHFSQTPMFQWHYECDEGARIDSISNSVKFTTGLYGGEPVPICAYSWGNGETYYMLMPITSVSTASACVVEFWDKWVPLEGLPNDSVHQPYVILRSSVTPTGLVAVGTAYAPYDALYLQIVLNAVTNINDCYEYSEDFTPPDCLMEIMESAGYTNGSAGKKSWNVHFNYDLNRNPLAIKKWTFEYQ